MENNRVIIIRMVGAFAEKMGKQLGEAIFYSENCPQKLDRIWWEERMEVIDGEIAEMKIQLQVWGMNWERYINDIDTFAQEARSAKAREWGKK